MSPHYLYLPDHRTVCIPQITALSVSPRSPHCLSSPDHRTASIPRSPPCLYPPDHHTLCIPQITALSVSPRSPHCIPEIITLSVSPTYSFKSVRQFAPKWRGNYVFEGHLSAVPFYFLQLVITVWRRHKLVSWK